VINARTLLYIQTFTITLIAYLVLSNFLSWVAGMVGARMFHPPLVLAKRTRRPSLIRRRVSPGTGE
jgi:polar amino acid transport system permease protein